MLDRISHFCGTVAYIFAAYCATAITAQASQTDQNEVPEAIGAPADNVKKTPPIAVRNDTPSGYPVPRFVSLKSSKTFCRGGPTFSHAVQMTYMRKGLPVIVVAETRDHWRKIRDRDNDECWIHKSKLSGEKMALIDVEGAILFDVPSTRAPVLARYGRGSVARIDQIRGSWRRVRIGERKGWMNAAVLWGATTKISELP